MVPIEDRTDADRARVKLEDHLNEAITALIQARHYHQHMLDHHGASGFTVRAQTAICLVGDLEEALVDWQDRQEDRPQEVPC